MKLRDQPYGYGQLPNRDEMVELYKSYTLEQIGEMFGTNKTRVRKWFDKLGIKKRPQGGGNNRKVIDILTEECLRELIDNGNNVMGIASSYDCTANAIYKLLKKYNIIIDRKTSEYRKYCSRVRLLTQKTYNEHKEIINPDNHPRTLCGVEGGYQIDHKLSVRFCYDNGISAEQCASLENLQMLTWQENLNKRTKNIYEEQYVANRGTSSELDS